MRLFCRVGLHRFRTISEDEVSAPAPRVARVLVSEVHMVGRNRQCRWCGTKRASVAVGFSR